MSCSADIYRRYLFIFCVRPCGPGIERRSARQLQNHPWLEIHASNVLGRTIIFPRLSPTQRSPDTFVDFCFFFSFFASTTRQFHLITECLPIKEAGLRRCPWKLFFPFLFFFLRSTGVNSWMQIPQKVDALILMFHWFWASTPLQYRWVSLCMWPKCSLLKQWIVALNFPCTLIAPVSHLRQDTGDDPLFWQSLFFNGSYFSPFHLSISLECWGFCGCSMWACNCQRPLLTVPVFCMWKDLEGATWALN